MKKLRPLFVVFILLIISAFTFIAAAQEKKEPAATVTAEFFKAPQKFDRVDRNQNKILDDLEDLIGPAAGGDRFDVIVMAEKPLEEVLPALKSRHGDFTEKFTYPAINGFATSLTKGQIIALSQDADVKLVEFDAPVYPHLDTSQQWFGTTKARGDFGVDGNADGAASYSAADVVIAILDTGIDPNHVDLGPGKIIAWRDATVNNNQSGPYDELGDCGGHGTHVSSIAAGEGDGDASLKGVAPGAALVGIKVLSLRTVRGQVICTAATSEIVSGVQWMIDNRVTYGIKIGNMSLGAAGCSDGTDSMSAIVNTAVDNGIVMTVSAGNEGPGPCTVGSPAAAEKAITVGAMADVIPGASAANVCGDNDLPNAGFYLACFSSRGKTADNRIKPDIVSPGVFIRAAKAGTTNDYIVYSGTSMSSPFTAGVAALMLDANSGLTTAQIKQKIGDTALDWGPAGADVDYGSGRLQGYEAVKNAGSLAGTGPPVPAHFFNQGTITASDPEDIWSINVTDASLPLAITMIMPNWKKFNDPDIDMELKNPSGAVIATSISATRQETIGVQPATTGTYQLRVYRYAGSGSYFFDVSFGEAAVAITVGDGAVAFGIVPLGATIDSTNDPQIITVTAGPADLDVKSTNFSDGTNTWILGTTNGANQVKWEFSKDTTAWATFAAANTLYTFDNNVAQGNTRNLYLRLTMPTSTSSNNQHSSTVTIVATAP